MMIGWVNTMSAQEDLKLGYIAGSVESIDFQREYVTFVSQPVKYVDYSLAIYDKLLDHFGYVGKNTDIKFLSDSKQSKPMSKFQLIVDEEGKIIDCALLESTDSEKDKLVMECLRNEKYFENVPKLNGEPCKSVVLLSFRYHKSGNFDVTRYAYPVLPLSDSETASASTAPSSMN